MNIMFFKPTLRHGLRPILQKTVGSKEFKLIYDVGGAKMVKNVPVVPGRSKPVRHLRRRYSDARTLGMCDRGALQQSQRQTDADGHRVGEGWTHR